jgi:hypothetical protein
LERLDRSGEERFALGRQPDPSAGPFQQGDTEEALELADLGAEDLLGDVHPPGGRGETTLLGDGDEVAEVAQLQARRAASVTTAVR